MAEGDGLLNRYTGKTCIEGSNPSLSAIQSSFFFEAPQNKQEPKEKTTP